MKIYFTTNLNRHNVNPLEIIDVGTHNRKDIDMSELEQELCPTTWLKYNGQKCSFVYYFSHMWTNRLANFDESQIEQEYTEPIILSSNVYHLTVLKQYFHCVLKWETEILGNPFAFETISERIKKQPDLIEISVFKPGYEVDQEFLKMYGDNGKYCNLRPQKNTSKETNNPTPEEQQKKEEKVLDDPTKNKPRKKVKIEPLNKVFTDYCKDISNNNGCCTKKCEILNLQMCELNFDKEVLEFDFAHKKEILEKTIKNHFEPSFI